MNKILSIFILTICFVLSNLTYSQDSLKIIDSSVVTFQMQLDSSHMTFETPKGYIEIDPIPNRQMNYEKAFKHPSKRFEVRYAIRRHNYGWYRQMFEMTALNISGGRLPEYTNFGTEAVKKEFNADAGCVVTLLAGEEFGQDYKYCMLVYIYKKGIGDGYIFYLADDNKIIPELMLPIFHSLKFGDTQ